MLILRDLHECHIDEKNVTQAYTRDKFILECYNLDNTITSYKYDNFNLLMLDMKRINGSEKNQILCG